MAHGLRGAGLIALTPGVAPVVALRCDAVQIVGGPCPNSAIFRSAEANSGGLVGSRTTAAPPASAGMTVDLLRSAAFQRVRVDDIVVPALVSGLVAGAAERAVVAVAVNGRVEAVTRLGDSGTFRALVPPTSLRNGRNLVEILSVSPSRQLAKIRRSPPASD